MWRPTVWRCIWPLAFPDPGLMAWYILTLGRAGGELTHRAAMAIGDYSMPRARCT
jgi:ABC-type phosphate transport system permease subunit